MSGQFLPLIGVTACRRDDDGHKLHKVSEKYVTCVPDPVGGVPLMIPALGNAMCLDSVVAHIDGLLLTGSPSNVLPAHYEGAASAEGTAHDADRDLTVLPLIRKAVAAGVPVLGICRGIQELNVALGGTLHQRIFDMADRFDHRMRRDASFEMKYRPAHQVRATEGGLLHRIAGQREFLVNSLHAQGIDRPGDGVVIEAVAPDGIVEAISVPGAAGFVFAVQWHPEWPQPIDGVNRRIFQAFGDAARAYAMQRRAPAGIAAE